MHKYISNAWIVEKKKKNKRIVSICWRTWHKFVPREITTKVMQKFKKDNQLLQALI